MEQFVVGGEERGKEERRGEMKWLRWWWRIVTLGFGERQAAGVQHSSEAVIQDIFEWQCLTFALFDGSDLQSSWHKIVLFGLELYILLISFCQVRSTQEAHFEDGMNGIFPNKTIEEEQ